MLIDFCTTDFTAWASYLTLLNRVLISSCLGRLWTEELLMSSGFSSSEDSLFLTGDKLMQKLFAEETWDARPKLASLYGSSVWSCLTLNLETESASSSETVSWTGAGVGNLFLGFYGFSLTPIIRSVILKSSSLVSGSSELSKKPEFHISNLGWQWGKWCVFRTSALLKIPHLQQNFIVFLK